MIESLSLRNFKVLRNVNVKLRPLTLVVGPNGSGKSSILLALNYAGYRIVEGRQGAMFTIVPEDSAVLTSRMPEGPLKIEISGAFKGERFSLGMESSEVVPMPRVRIFEFPDSALVRPVILDLDLKKLAAPAYIREIVDTLPSDGMGLSWFLAGLQLEFPEIFGSIVDRLREVVPSVQGLRLKRTALESGDIGYELLFDMKGGSGIPAYAVSEGTLVTLALLTVLASPKSPQLILVDNLERGLHPKALGDLISQIRSLQKQNPELQIVATSHSPYLLDYLEAEEILLTSLDEDGYASVKALSEHPDYERWKDVMAPGEFWSTVGESWVVQKASR